MGYVKYANEHPELLCDDPDINQSTLWVQARKDKDGNLDPTIPGLEDTVSKIDELISDKKEGKLHLKVTKGTILENALGKEEHPGRVRGVGSDMTQTSYFKVFRGKKVQSEVSIRQQEELMAEKRKNAEQDERIAKLEALVCKLTAQCADVDQKGSYSVKMKSENLHDDVDDVVKLGDDDMDVKIVEHKDMLEAGKLVALSAESGTKIGYGTVLRPSHLTQPFPPNCIRVTIDEVVDENAPLPIPTDDCKSIGDTIGYHISWPMHLLKLQDEPKRKNKQEKKEPKMDYSKIPLSLRVVYCYCKALKNGNGTIEITLDKDLFGEEKWINVHHEDVEPICQLKPISYNCILVYIWHMYKKIQSLNKGKQFRFVDPYHVGYIPTNNTDKDAIDKGIALRVSSLAQGLSGTLKNQIVLVPCNVGNHWILTIIDPHMEEIGLLDPLYRGFHDLVWKNIVELALQVYVVSSKTRTERKEGPTWAIFEVPKQPDSFQCGYYVMKYMKTIVEHESNNSMKSLKSLFGRIPYSVAEIDEVRNEWAECVQQCIY